MNIKSKSGYILHGFISGEEQQLLEKHQPVTASLIVLRVQETVLFGFNRNREQWELPGGKIEPKETPRECAVRELEEESSQQVTQLHFAGLAHMQRPAGDFKYSAIYAGSIAELQPFHVNDEWNQIKCRRTDEQDGADLIHVSLIEEL